MILASAQTKPHRGNIEKNLDDHYHFIQLAALYHVQLIAFPEMSITGYERERAKTLAFTIDDARLDKLRKLSVKHRMIIVAGAPITINEQLFIGSFILQTNGQEQIYTKQFLHPGEEVAFQSSFDYNPLLEIEGERIAFAICADIDHPEHAENACQRGSTIYIPGIFFSPNGMPEAHKSLSDYAHKNQMEVLMSNYSGESCGMPAGGRSAFWRNDGMLIGCMDSESKGLLIVEKLANKWNVKVININ
jgi:predicted amidohydrolase